MQVFQTIRSLPRKVSREEALRHFTGGGRGIVASILRGRAQSIAEVFIPFTIFQVKIRNREREEMKIYALDAVAGSLDLFEFPETPAEAILATHTTRNFLRARLTPEQAQEKLTDKVRRLVFSRGFAQLRDLRIEAIANPADLHVPYLDMLSRRQPGGENGDSGCCAATLRGRKGESSGGRLVAIIAFRARCGLRWGQSRIAAKIGGKSTMPN